MSRSRRCARQFPACASPVAGNESSAVSGLQAPSSRYNHNVTRYWTTYWSGAHWLHNEDFTEVVSSGGTFRKRGIKEGDVAYIVSVQRGVLFLGGKMEVQKIVSRNEAIKIRRNDNLYAAPDWLIGVPGSGSPLILHRSIDPEIAGDLRFISGRFELPLKFKHGSVLDEQTLRTVRELTAKSARLFDEVIRLTDLLPRDHGPILVSAELLRRLSNTLQAFLPEEVPPFERYLEGSVKTTIVNRYERDPNARATCLAHFGPICVACDENLAARYGEAAAGVIHVHHLVPLAGIGRRYVVDPVNDLRPVCPNCHAVIHRREPPYSITEIREFLAVAKSTAP